MNDFATELTLDGNSYELLAGASASNMVRGKVYLGSKKTKCRYCGETDPNQLGSKAHLIPEALGNKRIFNYEECHRCNNFFSQYEDHLDKVVRSLRAVGGIKGKTGVPRSFGGADWIGRTIGERPGLRYFSTDQELDDVVAIDPIQRKMIFKHPVPNEKFRPRWAYKALVKIGLGVLPEDELQHFTKLFAWLQDRDDDVDFPCLEVCFRHSIIANPMPIIDCSLLRRASPNSDIPYMMSICTIGAFCFQIDLMSDDQDNHVSPRAMGSVKINWNGNIEAPDGSDTITHRYLNPALFNWSSAEWSDHPLAWLLTEIQMDRQEVTMRTIPRTPYMNPIRQYT